MTLFSPFNQWEFSVFGETGNSLFSKDVYSPSIFLGSHPLPSQVFRFALASSSLANRDSIRKAREAFLIQKGRTIDPDGLNIREETYNRFPFIVFFYYVILFYRMLIFNLHCQLVLRISGITKTCCIKHVPM